MNRVNLNNYLWGALCAAALLLFPNFANAQTAGSECSGGLCGTPNQSGGGCGCGCGCSILINQTDLGDTYQYSDDFDNDGWEDDFDNCPFSSNGDQADNDGDGFGNSCDNCLAISNPSQANANGNAQGDDCDSDADGDGIPNPNDNCSLFPNPDQKKSGPSALGDVCNPDIDGDGVPNVVDNCILVINPGQASGDPSQFGNACGGNLDTDGDSVPDLFDNCPTVPNTDQHMTNRIAGGLGDACNVDMDADGIPNTQDNCRTTANPTQVDADRDGSGEQCDDKFCFTIDSPAAGRCLDPEAPFFSRPGPDMTVKTGEKVRLRMFSNRAQTAIRYTWAMDSSPNGKRGWTIQNPRGAVTNSSPWEYRYTADRTPSFLATEPGEYMVRLESELVFPDAKGFNKNTDVQTFKIKVEGKSKLPIPGLTSCSEAGQAFPLLSGLALLGMMFRRRK